MSFCQSCNVELDQKKKNNKFCSRSCSAIINNSKRKKIRPCVGCGKQLGPSAKKYCSNRCQFDYCWGNTKQKINEKGLLNGIRQARRYLLEKNKSCQMCGTDSWLGKPILLICDHINGNSNDWRLENLRMICSNCDATTPHYKNKNKGNGRAYRRERYKLGKSF
jgi:predicted nucleic acid-binding Zn ribbon protein